MKILIYLKIDNILKIDLFVIKKQLDQFFHKHTVQTSRKGIVLFFVYKTKNSPFFPECIFKSWKLLVSEDKEMHFQIMHNFEGIKLFFVNFCNIQEHLLFF